MKLAAPGGPVHLTYCTNIHRGERWAEIMAALERHVPAIRAALGKEEPMGLGLRLSAIAAETVAEPAALDSFRGWLAMHRLYVFTLNGFPYGPFHGTRVKEQVYEPDWRTPERLAYTSRLAELLAALLPDEPGLEGSISTVPLGFRPGRDDPAVMAAYVANLQETIARLVELERRTGKRIALALEPEPMCALETTAEAVAFLEERILAGTARARLADRLAVSPGEAELLARRHLGLCLDVCHAAVEFEEPQASLALVEGAGIAVPKLQLSAALVVPRVDRGTMATLRRFEDGVYLHQVVERAADGTLRRFLDLAPAFAAIDEAIGREWRVHCHVPIFSERLGEGLASTRPTLEQVLAIQARRPISRHLEVETYTFDVLPAELRAEGVEQAVARELRWARDRLVA